MKLPDLPLYEGRVAEDLPVEHLYEEPLSNSSSSHQGLEWSVRRDGAKIENLIIIHK